MNATFDEVEQEWKALEVGNTVGGDGELSKHDEGASG